MVARFRFFQLEKGMKIKQIRVLSFPTKKHYVWKIFSHNFGTASKVEKYHFCSKWYEKDVVENNEVWYHEGSILINQRILESPWKRTGIKDEKNEKGKKAKIRFSHTGLLASVGMNESVETWKPR